MGGNGGRDELKWCQLAHNQLISLQGPHFNTVQLKPTIKSQIPGRMVSSGICSVYSDKTHLKKLMIMIIIIIIIIILLLLLFIMNKLQETTVFRGRQKLASAMKLRPEK